jgi:hypothetical protein
VTIVEHSSGVMGVFGSLDPSAVLRSAPLPRHWARKSPRQTRSRATRVEQPGSPDRIDHDETGGNHSRECKREHDIDERLDPGSESSVLRSQRYEDRMRAKKEDERRERESLVRNRARDRGPPDRMKERHACSAWPACVPDRESRCRSSSRSCVDWFRDVSMGQTISHFIQVDQTHAGIGGNLVTPVRRSRSTGRSTQENTGLRTVCSGVRTGECAQHSLRVSFAPCISGSPLLPRTCVLPVNALVVDSPFVALGCAAHLPTQFLHQPRPAAPQ